MKKIYIEPTEQIKWMLSIGIDGKLFREKHLPSTPLGQESKNYYFDQIFTISEEDVYQYVLKNGWDNRAVCYRQRLPNLKNHAEIFYDYIILPPENKRFQLAHFGSFDRELWLRWEFKTEEEMFRFIIHNMFETQKGFWKSNS